MGPNERIFKQIVATGQEWKGCEHCGRKFETGEIMTAVQLYSGMVIYWECSRCTEEWLGPYDDELKLEPPALPSEYKLITVNPQTQQLEVYDGGSKAVPLARFKI